MILKTDTTLEEYYKEAKELYPELEFSEFEKICKNPFNYIKKVIDSDKFPMIHYMYFGKFMVYPGKVKAYIKRYQGDLESGKITQEEYELKTKKLEEYLIDNNEQVP